MGGSGICSTHEKSKYKKRWVLSRAYLKSYLNHFFKLNDLKKKGTMDLTEPTKFPHLSNNAKRHEV